jgi:hypothetical protein
MGFNLDYKLQNLRVVLELSSLQSAANYCFPMVSRKNIHLDTILFYNIYVRQPGCRFC